VRRTRPQERRCSYVVTLDRGSSSLDDLRSLSEYLSFLGVAHCDVVVLDTSPRFFFEQHRRVLRWVGRHYGPAPEHRTLGGALDIVRAAAEVAACEKVIVAGAAVRYTAAEIGQLCDLLEKHEVVEPQDYLHPLPWWGAIEAGRMLIHRGIEPHPDHGATYGFRRTIVRGMRGLEIAEGDDQVRRLAAIGLEVHPAYDVFVKRCPPDFSDWLHERPRHAEDDFALPLKSSIFFAIAPVAMLLALFGGMSLVGVYAGAIACAAMLLALRGRSGASHFFPLQAVACAPLWVAERSISVYWALYLKVRGDDGDGERVAVQAGASGEKVATGA
jgi:hypothetical protein